MDGVGRRRAENQCAHPGTDIFFENIKMKTPLAVIAGLVAGLGLGMAFGYWGAQPGGVFSDLPETKGDPGRQESIASHSGGW